MNTLKLSIEIDSDSTGEYRPVDIVIDGERLIDALRRIELPNATAEGSPDIAGQYNCLSIKKTLLPSRHFLGKSHPILTQDNKTAILVCTCGCQGCWDFVCRMDFSQNTVTWSEFEQVHRTWDYSELGTFTFDRKNYEDQISQLPSRSAPE